MTTFDLSIEDLSILAHLTKPENGSFYRDEQFHVFDEDEVIAVEQAISMLPDLGIKELRRQLVDYAANKRWQVETGGFVWLKPGTTKVYFIATDDRSQNKIAAERKAADENRRRAGDVWKCGDPATGSIVYPVLADADIIDMSNRARDRICDCFNTEAALRAAIEAGTITTTDEIDAADWPHT